MIQVQVSIRQGFNVWAEEDSRVAELRKLSELGIVKLRDEEWQICKNCSSEKKFDERFRRDGRSSCSTCGKTIIASEDKVRKKILVDSVDNRRIVRICDKALKTAFGAPNCYFDRHQNSWMLTVEYKEVPFVISGISSSLQYYDAKGESAWLCCLLNWEEESNILNYYNQIHFIRFDDVLDENTEEIRGRAKGLALSYEPNEAVEIAKKFDKYIKSIPKGQFAKFERDFVDSFLSRLKSEIQRLNNFFQFLSLRKQTIVNSKIIFLGGPSNPDFISLNLLDYLSEGLRPNRAGEVKRYFGTKFTFSHFSVATKHGLDSDTLCIVSTDNVQPEVWRNIWETFLIRKYFKDVLLDRSLIILLLKVVNAEDLLTV
ncbi:MAG: hypothetical protein M1587_02430 [Thaumarchaeota archaeon]|nr:hypothetical protein [Nitrososphaerota archaeon]